MSEQSTGTTLTIEDGEMSQIPKSFIFDGMTLPIPIFVRLKEHTYLMISKKGDKAQVSNLKSFKNDNFRVYVRTAEKFILTSFIESLTEKTIDNPGVTVEKKNQFIAGLLDESFQDLEKAQFTSIARLKSAGSLVVKLAAQVPSLAKALEIMEAQNPSESKHAMMTCMVSMLLAEEASLLNNLVQDKLAVGALLHDVGMKFIPAAIVQKPRHEWSAEELAIYQTHPVKGAEALRHIQGMSVEVLMIVAEHHELSNGTGYPKNIRDVRINNLAKIVGLADQFCELVSSAEGQTYTADQAVSYIENVLGQPFNKGLFSSLKNLVNVQMLADKMKKTA